MTENEIANQFTERTGLAVTYCKCCEGWTVHCPECNSGYCSGCGCGYGIMLDIQQNKLYKAMEKADARN